MLFTYLACPLAMGQDSEKYKTFSEIAADLGVHRSTLWRKLRPFSGLFSCNGQRKSLYSPDEQQLAKELFRTQ